MPSVDGPPREPSLNRWLLVGAIAAGLLFVVALTASGARSLGRNRGHPDYGSVFARAGVGAAIALAAGVAGWVVLGSAARRNNALARTLVPDERFTKRAFAARTLPWLTALVALGAVLGSATAPLYRAGTSAIDDTAGKPVDPRLPTFRGQLTRLANGTVQVQVDSNGDGVFEALVPCRGEPYVNARPFTTNRAETSDPLRVPIDFECDGKIDAYAELDSLAIRDGSGAAPPTTRPNILPGDPRSDTAGNAVDMSKSRFEGVYLRESNGTIRLYVDFDGDGRYETPMVACPRGTSPGAPTATTVPGETGLVPIDRDCNGTIDAYARVRDFTPRDSLPVPSAVPNNRNNTTPTPTNPSAGGSTSTDASLTGDKTGASLVVLVLLVALAGAALIGIAFVVARALVRPPEMPIEPVAEEPTFTAVAAEAVQSSLDDLAASTDPRIAIINAYARLLDGLSQAGLPRRPNETPGVYLRRCVTQLHAREAPMERLTELFSLARFSSHPITEDQRNEATRCLQQALADLQPAASELVGSAS